MTLQEVATDLASRLDAELVPGEDSFSVKIQGKGYHVVVGTFFGGWQAALHLPDQKPLTFYGEAVDMLELRIKAKLTGRDPNF